VIEPISATGRAPKRSSALPPKNCAMLERPDVKARFLEAGAEAIPLRPAEYAAQVQEEKRLFTAIVKSLGLKAD